MKVKRPVRKTIWEINITPLTDVALVLLIIFMVSAPVLLQSGIRIKLPSATTSEKEMEKRIVITVTADSRVYFGKEEMSKDKLLNFLVGYLQAGKTKIIEVSADKATPHGTVIQVLDIAKKAGAEKVTLSAIKKKD